MELVSTTPEIAQSILDKGNRVIVTKDGSKVEWVNLNNETLMATKKNKSVMFDFENVELFIVVKRMHKTIY